MRRAATGSCSCKGALVLLLSSLATVAHADGGWPELVPAAVRSTGQGARDAALVVGIERYGSVPPIAGAVANANDWYAYLVKVRGVPVDKVTLLRDHEGTLEKLRKHAALVASQVEKGGTLWFVFVGHGAPALDGKDGLLVGFDAQQDPDSLYARSLPQRELLALLGKGKQARTVAVIDACFSGRSWTASAASTGKALVPGLQPLVVARPSRPPPRTTLLLAGRGDQVAGPLPGAERPAFSYLTLGALRGWADRDGDGRVTAGEVTAYASDALRTLVHDRTQTPELAGRGDEVLGSEREIGPDLAAFVLRVHDDQAPPAATTSSEPKPASPSLGDVKAAPARRKHAPPSRFAGSFALGDVDGDGRTDVLEYRADGSTIPVCSSTASGWSCSNRAAAFHGEGGGNDGSGIFPGGTPLVGDFDGDGKIDLAQYHPSWWTLPLCRSTGDGWDCSNRFAAFHGDGGGNHGSGIFTDGTPLVGDFDGDGRSDVAQYNANGWWTIPVCLSTREGWSCTNRLATFAGGDHGAGNHGSGVFVGGVPLVGDFDGDGRDDVAEYSSSWTSIPVCFSRADGWSCKNSRARFEGGDYGAGNDGSGIFAGGTPLVGDFDGDGKMDLAQYHPAWASIPVCSSTGDGWRCKNLRARFAGGEYGMGNDGSGVYAGGTPLVGDFDGDGKADLAQYDPTWPSIPVCLSTGGGWSCKNLRAHLVGDGPGNAGSGVFPGGAPLVGDADGDGVSDMIQVRSDWRSIPLCRSVAGAWSCRNLGATVY